MDQGYQNLSDEMIVRCFTEMFSEAALKGGRDETEKSLYLFSVVLKGLPIDRIVSLRIAFLYSADMRPQIFTDAIDILDGQLVLREMGKEKGWR